MNMWHYIIDGIALLLALIAVIKNFKIFSSNVTYKTKLFYVDSEGNIKDTMPPTPFTEVRIRFKYVFGKFKGAKTSKTHYKYSDQDLMCW